MASWRVAEAKAKLSEVLDKADTEGPQLVKRRKQESYVLTREQLMERSKTPAEGEKPFVSAWDALRPSADDLVDYDFPRLKWTSPKVKF